MDTNNNSAKFAFFYMLSLVALIFMALSAGMIIFQIINKNIIDVLEQYRGHYSADQLKFAISALIISAPIFYFTARQIYKNLFSGALGKDSSVRRWLTYLVLFVSSVVMIGWLIATVNSFLDGELTIKFILKAVTAISIAASIFTFYLYDIKREQVAGKKDKVIQMYFYGSLAVVIAVFIASLFFVESPAKTRNRKLDNAILENFNDIDRAVSDYYYDEKKMPENLDKLVSEFNYLTNKDIEDPLSKTKYEYNIIDNKKYELCASFRTSNKDQNEVKYNYYKDLWPHDAGYQCISQKVKEKDKLMEPVYID